MLLKEKHGTRYNNLIPKRILKFLCNYWTVVVLFSVVGLVVDSTVIPGSVGKFMGNIFLYGINYNGAWWFVLTYIILLILSPILIKLVNNSNSLFLIFESGILYFIAYLFRFKFVFYMPNRVLNWMWQQSILLGTSQFSFMIGLICYEKKCISKLRTWLQTLREQGTPYKVKIVYILLGCVLPLIAFIGHCVIQSLIIAPITARTVLISLFVLELPSWLNKFLLLMGKHSTNIWLIHMFFYMYLFEGLVFKAKYPVAIFTFMMIICLCVSCFINAVNTVIIRFVENVHV